MKQQIEVERDGCTVRLIWRRKNEYDAMMLYDKLVKELQSGGTKITIVIERKSADATRKR